MSEAAEQHDFASAWGDLDAAWRLALELAWRSSAAGTIGVGSVLTAADGTVIARGRNRVYDAPGGDGLLQGTLLAHAEMNALVEVPASASLADSVLWSTQQPCLLCASAAVMAHVGAVRFLAADPFYGPIVDRMSTLNAWLEHAWPRYDGPTDDDRWAVSAMLLQLTAAATKNPNGEVMEANHRDEPETARLIERIVAERIWIDVANAGGDVSDALGRVWPRILNAADARRARRQSAAT